MYENEASFIQVEKNEAARAQVLPSKKQGARVQGDPGRHREWAAPLLHCQLTWHTPCQGRSFTRSSPPQHTASRNLGLSSLLHSSFSSHLPNGETPYPLNKNSPPTPSPSPGNQRSTLSLSLATLSTPCTRNHAVFVCLQLAYFTEHEVLKVHWCCCMSESPSFINWTIFCYRYVAQFVYWFTHWWTTGWLPWLSHGK